MKLLTAKILKILNILARISNGSSRLFNIPVMALHILFALARIFKDLQRFSSKTLEDLGSNLNKIIHLRIFQLSFKDNRLIET